MDARLVAIDLGRTNCKVGTFEIRGERRSLEGIDTVPVARQFLAPRGLEAPIPADGYDQFRRFMSEQLAARGATDLALALPFPIVYQQDLVGSLGEAGWPEQLCRLMTDARELGVERVTVLNDDIACGLGCLESLAGDALEQVHLSLTLGTYFGCALLEPRPGGSVVSAFEADDFFDPEHGWPDWERGSPTFLLNTQFANQDEQDEPAYRELVARLVCAIQRGTAEHREGVGFRSIFLGGGRSKALTAEEWATLFFEAGADPLQVQVVGERAALEGAARAWAHVHLARRPITDLVVTAGRAPDQPG